MSRAFLIALSLIGTSTPLLAQSPLSAIDWLSESISHPPEFTVAPDADPLVPPTFMDITTETGLPPVSPDAIGLLSPALTGFSVDLWGDLNARNVAELLQNHPNEGLPEAKNLFRRILLAQTNPPSSDTQGGIVLQARIDRLVQIGALDAAEALLSLDDSLSPALFAQMFDIAILTQRTTKVCEILKGAPALSNDLSTRVYCLARGGDWNAAAMTLSLGGSLSEIDPAREEMLIRFLDPELFEGEPDPAAPHPLSVMDFVLREAVFLPRPAGHLPLPYLYRDIGNRAPQRAKMDASERLVKAGSMPSNLLFSAYRDGDAAVSGGVWGRASAAQHLDTALENGDVAAISTALQTAYDAFAPNGLTIAFAEEYGETLAQTALDDPATSISHDLALLVGITENAAHDAGSAHQQLAHAIVTNTAPADIGGFDDALMNGIANAFWGEAPDNPTATRLLAQSGAGQQGAGILAALELLSGGALSDPESVRSGLYLLNTAGQHAAAKRIAVQILLLPVGE